MPSTSEEWLNISEEFERMTGFPHWTDGKHMQQRGSGSGSYFYNYVRYHSQILMALVDANYRFLYYNAGANGRCNGRISFQ